MARYCVQLAVCFALALLFAQPAFAGFSVDAYIDNVFFETVNDNSAQDLNPAVGDIQYHFTLSDVANRWVAEGDLFAEGGYNGVPPVSTVVTNTLIEKVANVPIFSGEIDFYHNYAASGLQSHSANIDGEFDNEIDHDVKGASLEYYADINAQPLGGYATGFYAGPGHHVFLGSLGPLLTPTTTEHHMKLRFYLDSLGDSIELFNSAEIHTAPEPTSAGLLLAACAAMFLSCRRARCFS